MGLRRDFSSSPRCFVSSLVLLHPRVVYIHIPHLLHTRTRTHTVATAQSAEEALVRIEAARRAFPVKDGGSIHGFDVIIVEENLSGAPPGGGGGRARRRENDASTQSAGDDSVQRRWNMTSGSCLCCHLAESQRLYGGDDAGTGGGGGGGGEAHPDHGGEAHPDHRRVGAIGGASGEARKGRGRLRLGQATPGDECHAP